jgi:hypothetical protein
MNIFNADRTKYRLPDGLAELIDDARSILGDEFNECDSQPTGEVLAKHLKGLNEISLTDFMNLFDRLRDTRRIKSNAELATEEEEREPEPVDDRPRDTDGRLLSENEIFYKTKTAREIRERIKAEPASAFAKFAKAEMIGEFQQSGDGVQSPSAATAHLALQKFAQQYIRTPSAQLRPIAGCVTVDGTRFTIDKFNQLVEEATAAKLI